MILRSLCTDFQYNFHFSLSPDKKSVKTAFLRRYGGVLAALNVQNIQHDLIQGSTMFL